MEVPWHHPTLAHEFRRPFTCIRQKETVPQCRTLAPVKIIRINSALPGPSRPRGLATMPDDINNAKPWLVALVCTACQSTLAVLSRDQSRVIARQTVKASMKPHSTSWGASEKARQDLQLVLLGKLWLEGTPAHCTTLQPSMQHSEHQAQSCKGDFCSEGHLARMRPGQ